MPFDVRAVDLTRLNTLTKYPSIPTYHLLDSSTGSLLDDVCRPPPGELIATEKVDGTNARIVILPDGTYLIGSREEWLYARGDLLANPALGIAAVVRPIAENVPAPPGDAIQVIFGEVYGGRVTSASREYTSRQEYGFRLFDVANIPNTPELLAKPLSEISAWREQGGQCFLTEPELQAFAERLALKLTPRVTRLAARDLPIAPDAVLTLLEEWLPTSRVRLDPDAGGEPEGLVIRTSDRGWIAKIRYEDYRRPKRRKKRNG